jgi:hypothetical protein
MGAERVSRERLQAAYDWGFSRADRPFQPGDRETTQRYMALSGEEHRAYMRGMRDSAPARAPLPLPYVLARNAVWLAVLDQGRRRGGRWFDYVLVAPILFGIARLDMDLEVRVGQRRARAAGAELERDAPPVPAQVTGLQVAVIVAWRLARLLIRDRRPRRAWSNEESVAQTLQRDLVRWWAWRPLLRSARRRAAPPA